VSGATCCLQPTGWSVLLHTTLGLGKKGKDIKTEVNNNVETSKNSHFAIYHFTKISQVSVTHIYNVLIFLSTSYYNITHILRTSFISKSLKHNFTKPVYKISLRLEIECHIKLSVTSSHYFPSTSAD
jgi:hypothetical protein